ncbi:MAG TPA: thiamine pyrophosphate-binding protein [Polyangiales bacterium]|nr:thiamine pyrophosphate-binding protein [Polyangiales bacterium]
MHKPLSVADLLVEQLIACGVSHVFGVGGANIEDMFAAVQRQRPRIQALLAKHEHGAATAASGYARVKGGLGVVLATSGGGAMNCPGRAR